MCTGTIFPQFTKTICMLCAWQMHTDTVEACNEFNIVINFKKSTSVCFFFFFSDKSFNFLMRSRKCCLLLYLFFPLRALSNKIQLRCICYLYCYLGYQILQITLISKAMQRWICFTHVVGKAAQLQYQRSSSMAAEALLITLHKKLLVDSHNRSITRTR